MTGSVKIDDELRNRLSVEMTGYQYGELGSLFNGSKARARVDGIYRVVQTEIAKNNIALDRLAAKLQTYRARSINSSQASLLDALADDIAEEREKVRPVPPRVAPDHADVGPGFTHHDDAVCCPCPCRKGAE